MFIRSEFIAWRIHSQLRSQVSRAASKLALSILFIINHQIVYSCHQVGIMLNFAAPRAPLVFPVSKPPLPILLLLLEVCFLRLVTPDGPPAFAFGLELYPFEPPRLFFQEPRLLPDLTRDWESDALDVDLPALFVVGKDGT
jgi:hypothetical protein